MKNNHLKGTKGAIAAFIAVTITSCGGGGSSTASSSGSTSIALPSLITASLIVDVNKDGKNDVILSSQGDGYSAPMVLLNNGNGSSFTVKTNAIPSQYMGVNGAAVDIEAGDFNNDGNIDLLVSTVDTTPATFYQSSQIQLYLGNGDGTFTDATANIPNNISPTYSWYDHVRIADFNGDGNLDFATTSSIGGAIYLGDGTGNFTAASLSVTNGTTTTVFTSLSNYDLWLGDINKDGLTDLFSPGCACSFINTTTGITPAGTLSFNRVNTSATGMQYGVLVDIDGDGKLDMIGSYDISSSAATTVPVVAFLGDGTGNFTLDSALIPSPPPGLVHGRQFLAADLNGDGFVDVLISDHGYDNSPYPGARNWLLLNNGASALTDSTAASLDLLSGYTHQSAIGDLNGDGKPDIILNNAACNGTTLTCDNEPRFWLNNGTGVFASYNPVVN